MSYTVEELNPKNPVLIIGNKEINLSLITLHVDVMIKEKYGSLQKMFEAVNEKPDEIINITWILVLSKSRFDFTFEVFKKYCLTSNEPVAMWVKSMRVCLQEAVSKSMPLIKNKERYNTIQKIKGSTTDSVPCIMSYYDSIAKRYSYTLDKFYDLTMRQIHIILVSLEDKLYEELEIQAALQGRKLKPRINYKDISEEEEKENEDQAIDALKRLQEEYKAKKEK